MKDKISVYFDLTKPRISILVLVTAYLGYYMGQRSQGDHMMGIDSYISLLYLLIGTWTTSSCAAVLNQVIEWKQDAQMARTKNRPIVVGAVGRFQAVIFASILGISGFVLLYKLLNPITAWISAATVLLYIFLYF